MLFAKTGSRKAAEADFGHPAFGRRNCGATRARMKAVLSDIQTGKFVRDFTQENAVGQPLFKATRRISDEHQIEKVGEKLRVMMPWIAKGKMVEKARN